MSTATETTPKVTESTNDKTQRIVFNRSAPLEDQLAVIPVEFEMDRLWLDFSGIEIVNSTELASLIRLVLRVRLHDTTVLVSHVSPELQQIFELTRFSRYCQTVEPDRATA